jgi:IclR family pca regulon transcriptional regulator
MARPVTTRFSTVSTGHRSHRNLERHRRHEAPQPSASGRVLLADRLRSVVAQLLARKKITRLTRHTLIARRNIAAVIDQARRDGHSINRQEIEEDLVSTSVPVTNRAGLVVAALNVCTSASRFTEPRMKKELLPKLKATASVLSGMPP